MPIGSYGKEYPEHETYTIQRLRIFIKGRLTGIVADNFIEHYSEIMDGKCNQDLLSMGEAADIVKTLRDIEKDYIYYCPEIVRSKAIAYRILSKLLEVFIPAALNMPDDTKIVNDHYDDLIYSFFSTNYRYVCLSQCQNSNDDHLKIYNKLLLATDFISGMTDSYAYEFYRIITAGVR